MAAPFVRRLAMPLYVAGASALTVFVFHRWGLRGSAVLIVLFGLFWIGFRLWIQRTRRRIRETFAAIPEHQRAAALAALSESERAEVLNALKVWQ